jgi:tetratricopeptide (TPR) repeat protein
MTVITNSVNSATSLFSILGGQQVSQARLQVLSAFSDNNSPLFSALASQQQLGNQSLALSSLAAGADRALAGDYKGAALDFTRAISYDPSTDNVVKAYNLIAAVDKQDNNLDDALKAYKSSLAAAPQNDATHVSLGNIYFSQKDYANAEKEYKSAVSLNPTSSTDIFSLGQAYLAEGRYQEAEKLFQNVISMSPESESGYYALGQTYSKEGRYGDAISEFQKVISVNPDFFAVHIDLGSAYADLGQTDKANEELSFLKANDPNNAPVLGTYIDSVTKPQFIAAYGAGNNNFNTTLGPGTPAYALNSSLATPNTAKLFSMVFVFNKDMDPLSVQNPYNWAISKSQNGAPGGAYNWGLPVRPTDVQISPIPVSVAYDASSASATVSFLIQQNAAGTGTIDPSHIMFKFSGSDMYGNTMNTTADEYGGISQIV